MSFDTFEGFAVVDPSVSWNELGLKSAPLKSKVADAPSAFLITVIFAGKVTASLDSDRSWLPPEPFRSTSRVWNGEPAIDTAELVAPQFSRVAMWPPQARTGLARVGVKVIVIRADLSPVKPVPSAYE